jgi:hypothetical protein
MGRVCFGKRLVQERQQSSGRNGAFQVDWENYYNYIDFRGKHGPRGRSGAGPIMAAAQK